MLLKEFNFSKNVGLQPTKLRKVNFFTLLFQDFAKTLKSLI